MAQTRTGVRPPFSANELAVDGTSARARPTSPGRALHYYARLLAASTLILVAAGGMVTSTNSGLAVPDWPTTYGHNMFTFPLQDMVGGIFYEHGHRLIASTVGFLTIGLVAWLWISEPRAWVRKLGWIALGVVILQGTLGGLTVLFFLPDAISISHAGLAQIFFCLTISLALFTSRGWKFPGAKRDRVAFYEKRKKRPGPFLEAPSNDTTLQRRLIWLTGLVYVQILLGATMRHTGAGLAIPDFPLMFGGLLPPSWTAPIAIHFAHRMGAVVVTIWAIVAIAHVLRQHRHRPELTRPAWLLAAAITAQVTLGAFVVLTGKQPVINTLHVATGALVLGTSLLLTLRAHRARFAMPAVTS